MPQADRGGRPLLDPTCTECGVETGKPVLVTGVLVVLPAWLSSSRLPSSLSQFEEAVGHWRSFRCADADPNGLVFGHTWPNRMRLMISWAAISSRSKVAGAPRLRPRTPTFLSAILASA